MKPEKVVRMEVTDEPNLKIERLIESLNADGLEYVLLVIDPSSETPSNGGDTIAMDGTIATHVSSKSVDAVVYALNNLKETFDEISKQQYDTGNKQYN